MSTQIILSLAHLLHQHSPDYESSKNSLLDTTASLAMQTAHSKDDEVHMVLTGSPRPTFAETNAWLLERGGATNRSRSNTADSLCCGGSVTSQESCDLQEYIHENSEGSTRNANLNDLCGSPTKIGGSVLSHFRRSKGVDDGDVGAGAASVGACATEEHGVQHVTPLVGQAVVNAIAQTKGIGLQSSRAKLLQGTIDRPLWDQRRWTDGECLFSDLVDRCGLESFANTSSSTIGDAADSAAGNNTTLSKMSNLSAHLITVPPQVLTSTSANRGMEDETVNEIARAIIRFLKRKNSPPASVVYVVMMEEDGEKKSVIRDQLVQAWDKLEKYNDMIGLIKLLYGVQFEFVDA